MRKRILFVALFVFAMSSSGASDQPPLCERVSRARIDTGEIVEMAIAGWDCHWHFQPKGFSHLSVYYEATDEGRTMRICKRPEHLEWAD